MATWLSGISRQHRVIRKNIFLWFGLFLLAFVLVLLRFAWLQTKQMGFYREKANNLHKRVITIPFKRGGLYDRNLVPLAVDDARKTLYADPSLIQYPEFTAKQLAPVINVPEEKLLAELTHVTIKSRLEQPTAESIRALNLPGIFVNTEGAFLRIGVNWQQVAAPDRFAARLAQTLNVPLQRLRDELGYPVVAPPPAAPEPDIAGEPAEAPPAPEPPKRPTGTYWLKQTFPASAKPALEALKLTGLLCTSFVSYRVEADQRLFADEHATTGRVAAALAPPLGMDAAHVARLLRSRPRYAKLKANLQQTELAAIQRMQGAMYVVQPGKVLDAGGKTDTEVVSGLNESVERIYDMLNGKGGTVTITREQIRERLSPHAQPGLLGVKLNQQGQPDIIIPRRLNALPIPGVIYGLPGIGIQEEPCRRYPFNALASASLGWVSDMHTNPRGVFGIEETQEEQLNGQNGREEKEIDARRRTMPERSQRIEPVHGLGVTLTLDVTIQQIAEKELADAVNTYKALRGQCIVIDPHTGEILALATYPSWDANKPANSPIPHVNPAVSNYYEPGSTFKIVPVMAALEEKLIRHGEKFTACSGSYPIGGRTINEAHNAHGQVDAGDLLERSCNIGSAQLALRLGSKRYLQWCENLGFGKKTHIELGQEIPGSLNYANADAKITLANMGFGQSLAVTPIQMAVAYAVIANGGEWVQPHLVKSLQNPDGSWRDLPPVPRHRVCTPETAALMRGYLERVVAGQHGTGKTLSLKEYGYRVGGKTGTAQKPGPGGYRSGKYIGSYIGVAPIDNPRMVVIAVIDEPKGSYYGGVVAGPVVKNVSLRALQYLNIPHSPPVAAATRPAGAAAR